MDSTADIDAARTSAGQYLQFYWENAEHDTPEDLEDDEVEIREAYAAIQKAVPGDPTSATCLALLELGKLRAHLNGEIGNSQDHFDEVHNPPTGLGEDDGDGRALASTVIRAAERALALQEGDNLAAFTRACALHWTGDDSAAAAAYRDALRLDPYDHIAKARIEELEGIELPAPPSGLIPHHPHGFHLLEMTHLVGHSGSTRGWVWLLNDPADVRREVDGYLDLWAADRGHTLAEECYVWTHTPGGPPQGAELSDAPRHTSDGGPLIDWAKVPLPDLGRVPLPAGRPIRWDGQLHFFGGTEHDD